MDHIGKGQASQTSSFNPRSALRLWRPMMTPLPTPLAFRRNPAFASAGVAKLLARNGLQCSSSICMSASAPPSPSSPRKRSRRELLAGATALVSTALLPPGALAAMYSADTSADKRYAAGYASNATLADVMVQINDGLATLEGLQRDWGAKTEALDGDVVRRVLGTVGVTSPLFNIRKTFLRAWKMIAESGQVDEDVIDALETEWNLVLDGISSVDFQIYSVSFTELLESKMSLVSKSKDALDETVLHYNKFIAAIPASLL